MHRFVFSPLPPPLRFRRERLLPPLRSSSSLLYIRLIRLADQFCLDFRFVVNLYSYTIRHEITDLSSGRSSRSYIYIESFGLIYPKSDIREKDAKSGFVEVVSVDDFFSNAVDIRLV